jgi:hypothetical protein
MEYRETIGQEDNKIVQNGVDNYRLDYFPTSLDDIFDQGAVLLIIFGVRYLDDDS